MRSRAPRSTKTPLAGVPRGDVIAVCRHAMAGVCDGRSSRQVG